MDVYRIIKWYRKIDSPRLKLLGILSLHVFRRRYLYIAIDPSLACNLRCRMCYFSNPEVSKDMKGVFTKEDIDKIAKGVFHRGLKIQIGDGAEPTTYGDLVYLVSKAHEAGIPHISISTNGNLLTSTMLHQLVDNGLQELILSTHGLQQDTYEYMMRQASFQKFTSLLDEIAAVKSQNPRFKLRINFTMCADNIDSLKHFEEVFSKVKPDILQLRPVQDIGSKAYDTYSMEQLVQKYDSTIRPVIDYCQTHGITCLYPELSNINTIGAENSRNRHTNQTIEMLPYFHLSPHKDWKQEYDPYKETFEQYSKRTKRVSFILKQLIHPDRDDVCDNVTKALNYTIQ